MYTIYIMNIQQEISDNLKEILKNIGASVENVKIEIPEQITHGDMTSNIAMQISKQLSISPFNLAQEIVKNFPKSDKIEKIEVMQPGFINFFFSDKYLLEVLREINTDEKYFNIDILKDKKYVIEYTDPNPFKTFHIGHLYTNMVGESFAGLTEALGACVVRANYQGDVGLHVAKTMWGLEKILRDENSTFNNLSKRSLNDRVRYLGDAYMLGFKMYDDLKDEEVINDVKNINYYIFSLYIKSLPKREFFEEFDRRNIQEMYSEGRKWCLEYFEEIYKRTGTKFDRYYFESQMGEDALRIVRENMNGKDKNIFKESSGSIIYEGDPKKGLHTRVFVNSEGLPTYEAKEIALALKKYEDINFDKSIIITANEQTPYFNVVLDALSQLNPQVANSTVHIGHGLVKLPGAEKMSSRKGKIIEGEWLLNQAQKKVEEVMRKSGKWDENEIKDISDKVAISAVKYSFLKVSVGKDVIFDLEKATSFDGDSGPYLLYVYARCMSILREHDGKVSNFDFSKPSELDAYTKELLRAISRYNYTLLLSAINYSPSILCSYLFDLGKTFSSFYQNVKVLGSDNEDFLLQVIISTANVIKNGLKVLGIDTVDRM